MAMMLKQSTAVDVLIGPFVDLTNGASAETGESPAVKLSKNGQTLAAKNDITTPTHDADGYYNCELDATDTNTVGTLTLTVAASATALPVRHEFQVIAANVYDSLYAANGTDLLQVETTTNSDKTGYSISGTKTTLDSLNDIAATDIVSSGAITTSGGAVSNVTTVATTTTNTDMRGTDGAYTGTPPTTAQIADAVLDEVLSGHVAVGTLGKAIADIEADTNELQSDNVPGLIAALNDISITQVNAQVDTALADYDAPTKAEMDAAFAALNDISTAQVNAEVDTALADYDAPTKAELDAGLAALNDLSTTDILGMAYESTEDFQDFLRLTRAVLLGKTTGAGTGTENFRDRADGKNRVVSTIDSNGDRTAITTDAT